MTKFAIIIPTYQRADGRSPMLVNRALQSILQQSYKNFKVYLIGDRYENKKEFANFGLGFNKENFYSINLPEPGERTRYENNKRLLWLYGGIAASNYGINLALQEGLTYICRLDHDDYWKSGHLKLFNDLINKNNADWMCTRAVNLNRILPTTKETKKYISFLPHRGGLIQSATCINQRTIPLLSRDYFKETGKVGIPGDADLWERMAAYIKKNKLKSFLINEVSCIHDEEGYSKR
jgi:glycosyltransferase involved in cell wall biosynthesis